MYILVLEVDDLQPEDAGTYKCTVNNANGDASTQVDLKIDGNYTQLTHNNKFSIYKKNMFVLIEDDEKKDKKKPEEKKPEEKKEEKKAEEKKAEEKKAEEKKDEKKDEKKEEEKKPEEKKTEEKKAEPVKKDSKGEPPKKDSKATETPASFKEKPKDQVDSQSFNNIIKKVCNANLH
jgi:outer membrane biosynthesis protein TonB